MSLGRPAIGMSVTVEEPIADQIGNRARLIAPLQDRSQPIVLHPRPVGFIEAWGGHDVRGDVGARCKGVRRHLQSDLCGVASCPHEECGSEPLEVARESQSIPDTCAFVHHVGGGGSEAGELLGFEHGPRIDDQVGHHERRGSPGHRDHGQPILEGEALGLRHFHARQGPDLGPPGQRIGSSGRGRCGE